MLSIHEVYATSKPSIKPIRKARYNRCLRLKAKLAILKNEFFRSAVTKNEELAELTFKPLQVKLPSDEAETVGLE